MSENIFDREPAQLGDDTGYTVAKANFAGGLLIDGATRLHVVAAEAAGDQGGNAPEGIAFAGIDFIDQAA